ncbi:MAG: Mur ligase domain-containing protein [Victivallaceae bacterium]|nr:Mur ligase domain-containing protein [Victivallaceae bacterium]
MASYHFVGIGGIGMSALAAMCRAAGHRVSGSDRGYGLAANERIFSPLEKSGIAIYRQDGSFRRTETSDFLVWSTAIEEDNPDLVAGKGIVRLHRSELLKQMLDSFPGTTIAVTGSCGKSSVTAYLAEALDNLGFAPDCLNGALMKKFIAPDNAGNYRRGAGKYLVFESDESDKSLLRYQADYAVVLNLGCDHYDADELGRVFGTFLGGVRRGAVIEEHVYEKIRSRLPPELPVAVFGEGAGCSHRLERYEVREHRAFARFSGCGEIALPQSGRHTALNALSLFALLGMLGVDREKALGALTTFEGIWRRNDAHGSTACGAVIFDDYAHNPEKIRACLGAMRECAPGKIFAVYQPHGYGPFGFMCDTLFNYLDEDLRSGDRFYLLEPYYAGGTSSHRPSAAEVFDSWRQKAKDFSRFCLGADRESVRAEILARLQKGDVVVVMGARDNSLSDFAESFRNA